MKYEESCNKKEKFCTTFYYVSTFSWACLYIFYVKNKISVILSFIRYVYSTCKIKVEINRSGTNNNNNEEMRWHNKAPFLFIFLTFFLFSLRITVSDIISIRKKNSVNRKR